MNAPPVTYYIDASSAPFSNFDLLAIAPFILLAVVVAGLRKLRRRQ